MFEEIKNYEVNGMMTEEDKNELLSVLDFLTVFSRGYCYSLGKPENKFDNALKIWLNKMCGWGWAQRTVAELIQASTAKAGSHVKITNGIIRLFPQHDTSYRKGKRKVVEVSNDGSNISGGIKEAKDVEIKKKKKPTSKQTEYILLRATHTKEECSKILGKTLQEIKQMEDIIIKNAQTSHIVNDLGFEELTDKSRLKDYKEIETEDEKITGEEV